MQAVADLDFLQFAEMCVERAECAAAIVAADGKVAVEPVALGHREDLALEVATAALVDAGGEVVFVDQGLQLSEAAINLRPRHRRDEMIDDDGGGAPLGLAAF